MTLPHSRPKFSVPYPYPCRGVLSPQLWPPAAPTTPISFPTIEEERACGGRFSPGPSARRGKPQVRAGAPPPVSSFSIRSGWPTLSARFISSTHASL